MITKKLLTLLFALSVSVSATEYGYLTTNNGIATMTLNEGDLFEIIEIYGDYYDSRGYPAGYALEGRDPATDALILKGASNGNGPFDTSLFYGPLELTLSGPSYNQATILYKLTKATEPTESSTPLNTVVIPTDANGTVQIILESSTDLVNWTAATPGEYSAETQNRFFRVRAVIIED